MFILALAWVVLAVAEGLAYSRLSLRRNLGRSIVLTALAILLVSSMAVRLGAGWQAWVLFCSLGAYRVINLVRFAAAHLPENHLRSVSLRAHVWLVSTQAVVLLVGAVVTHWHWSMQLLDYLAAAQLLVALVLLRASMHTWQHAHAPLSATPLTDKELPSVSVLVPARNETDDLSHCLESLIASDYPKLEILVLDDCSATKRTPEIIRSFAHAGVRFLQGQVPDETRWLPKNFAYAQLAHEASGELLLFCGVDALFEPHTIRRLVEALADRKKDMLSVMPLRAAETGRGTALLQAMRYYWELCLPRRFFKRPPVLSTCWLIRSTFLTSMGGFESISRSVSPEAPLARRAVVTDAYSFIRSDEALGVYSNKPEAEQYGTSVRVRYPQLHRRLELVALASLFELIFLLGPFIGLLLSGTLTHTMAYSALWGLALACLYVTYALVAVGARLTSAWGGWVLMPVAFVVDLVILHISMFKYEFSSVEWKGRNVCIPVMQVEPHVRNTNDETRNTNEE